MLRYNKYYEKAVSIYRALHRVPEIGFELEQTVRIVEDVLDEYGIAHTERYGRGSIVAEIGQGEKCIALRADQAQYMVALDATLHHRLCHARGHPT